MQLIITRQVLDRLQEQLATNKKIRTNGSVCENNYQFSYAKGISLSEKLSKAEKSVTRLAETTKINKH